MGIVIKTASIRLFIVLVFVGFGVVGTSTVILYNTTISVETEKVSALSRSLARLINSVSQMDITRNEDYPRGGARGATLSRIINAHLEEIGFRETGEYVLGEKNGGNIHFLIPSRIEGRNIVPIELNAVAAEPMRRALLGSSGVMFAPDYRGKQVLAGYEPLPDFNGGFVAKIDVAEIREPFYYTALLACLGVIITSGLSSIAFYIVSTRQVASSGTEHAQEGGRRQRSRLLLTLVVCFIFVGAASATNVIWLLFPRDIETQRSELLSLSSGLASLVNAIAEFDTANHEGSDVDGVKGRTIALVRAAMKHEPGFQETGEIVLGWSKGEKIHFLLPSRFTGTFPPPVSVTGSRAEPMRKALMGTSGVIADLDYRGQTVLAAFQPVTKLGAGLVAKLDMEEIRSPFVLTSIINASLTTLIVVLGLMLAPQMVGVSTESVNKLGLRRVEVSTETDDSSNTLIAVTLVIVVATVVFLVDLLTPLGLAAGVPYIALLVVGAWLMERRSIFVLAALATVLVFGGMAVSPAEGADLWKVLTNRLYAVFAIWLMAIVLMRSKETEGSLRESESKLYALIDSAPDATLIVRDDGVIAFANRQAESLFGYSRDEFEGMSVDALVPNDVAPQHEALRKGFIESSAARSMGSALDLKAVGAKGRMFPVEIALAPIETREGLVVAASIRDISDRKDAEKALAQQLALVEALVDTLPNPVFVKDPEARYTILNKAFLKAFGVEREDLIGKTVMDLERNPIELRRELQQEAEDLIRTGGMVHKELTRRYADGKDHDVLYWETAFKLSDGDIGGLVGIHVDITEQKELEREADSANRAKSTFLANMSHELRTPMNAIIGYSEMLAEDAEDEENEDALADLNKIISAGKHLLTLINDVLDVSKIEAGKMELYTEDFDVGNTLHEVTSMAMTLIEKQNNTLATDYGENLGVMHSDMTKIRQNLFNLISNAAKFTENGTVTLSAHRETRDAKDWLVFKVVDTGIGIPEEKLDEIFKEFSQADESTARHFGGTGLGLTLATRFTEMMEGRIWAESVVGEGSSFIMELPATFQAEAEPKPVH